MPWDDLPLQKYPSTAWISNFDLSLTIIKLNPTGLRALTHLSPSVLLYTLELLDILFQKSENMKRPQSAKPGYKGYWGQISTDQLAQQTGPPKNQHRQNIKIMKPDLTTHDFARILPKKIHQDKERLYSQALQLKQTVNELMEENVRLKTKISILQKEKDKMNRYIDSNSDGLSRQGNSRLNIYGNKSTDKENMIVRNLKKIVRESKEECEYLKTENQKIKKTIKYTKINQLEIEKKIILDENKRLSMLLEEYNSQIINQDEVEKENQELKRILQEQIEQNKAMADDNEKFQEIIEGLQEKIKAENEKFQTKEKKMQRDLALEKRKTNEQHKYIEDLRKELKTLQENQQKINMQKKPVKPAIRPKTSHPGNYRSTQTQPKESTLNIQANIPGLQLQTNEIKKKNEQLEKELKEVKMKLQQSENELSRRKIADTSRKENIEHKQLSPPKPTAAQKQRNQSKPQVQSPSKAKAQPVKLEKKYQFEDSPGKGEQSYANAFEPQSEEDNYQQQFEKVNQSNLIPESKLKQNAEIQKMKKDFQENQEEEEIYKKQDTKKKEGDKKKKKKQKEKGTYKPDKKILSEIKELLTYRMKSQRYPFQDLKADIQSADGSTFSYTDLCNMLVNEPFYLTSNYTKTFLSYCYQKQIINQNDLLAKDVLIAKIRKVIDDFELLDENEQKEMILRVTEMTSTYPYEFETAFDNIKNGEDTVRKQDLITMFQKLELEDKYIELIIAQLSLCSDDLQHLNFHGFFERFYIEQEEEYGDPNAIEEQGEQSQQSYKNSSRVKKRGKNTRKASEELDEKVGQYMLAPEQPIESKNYAYDEDIVSDDGRI